jgi:hypothetical protein
LERDISAPGYTPGVVMTSGLHWPVERSPMGPSGEAATPAPKAGTTTSVSTKGREER